MYYLSLRHIGCTAIAPADTERFGDGLAVAEAFALDIDNMVQAIGFVFRNTGRSFPALQRARMIARILTAALVAANIHSTHPGGREDLRDVDTPDTHE